MGDEVEELVKYTLESVNGYILRWYGMSGMGPMYRMLNDIWEFTGVRSKLESSINSIVANNVQRALAQKESEAK